MQTNDFLGELCNCKTILNEHSYQYEYLKLARPFSSDKGQDLRSTATRRSQSLGASRSSVTISA